LSYVDLMGNARWSDVDHTARGEAIVRATVPQSREFILLRRVIGTLFPDGHPLKRSLTAGQTEELLAAVAAFDGAEAAIDAAKADCAVLHPALDIEDAARALAAIAPAPEQGEDPFAEVRAAAVAAHQALLDAAPVEVLQLLQDRTEWRAAQGQAEEPQP